jgi:4-hydroxy-4-methyl-2-oxoglutarate aldolase
VEDLVKLGLPIWTRYIRVKGASKTTIGAINLSVTVGGIQISPDDIIVLDTDGGVCIQRERVDAVFKAAEARHERETRLREKLIAGEISYDLHGLRDYVEKNRME